ncbi:MAG: CcmD family protein [Chloroflexota bacterium]
MEGNLGFLLAALLATWVGILAYLLYLGSRLTAARREIEELKARMAESEETERP